MSGEALVAIGERLKSGGVGAGVDASVGVGAPGVDSEGAVYCFVVLGVQIVQGVSDVRIRRPIVFLVVFDF